MAESETLMQMYRVERDNNMMDRLRGKKSLTVMSIRATEPNKDYPEPWIIEVFPGMSICSIISVGGPVDNTVVSIISTDSAEKVLDEIQDA